jgi:dynein heavy chain, axonemal
MSSVLDDSRTLCLANGERIKLPHAVNVVFEVQDLRHACPCTVSRCGVVHMANGLIPMSSLVRSRGATTLKDLVRHLVETLL